MRRVRGHLASVLALSACGRIGFDEGGTAGGGGIDGARLRIDNRSRAEALVDFPVLVRLAGARIDYVAAGDDGRHLRFRDGTTGELLAHEIEAWAPDGTSIAWVRVPSIPAASDAASVVVRYEPATPALPPTDTWSNGFVGVYHGAGNFDDSTSGSRHASVIDGAYTPGLAGPALLLSTPGPLSYAFVDHQPIFDSIVTISGWLRVDTFANQFAAMVARPIPGSQTNAEYLGVMDGAYYVELRSDSGTALTNNGPPTTLGVWAHLALVHDSARDSRYFVNGTLEFTASLPGALERTPTRYFFGADCDTCTADGRVANDDFLDGAIDEVRFETVRRSPAWLDAHIASMRDTLVVDDG